MLISETNIAKRIQTKLTGKKLVTTDDVVRFLPTKYRDYTAVTDLSFCQNGGFYAVRGVMTFIDLKTLNNGRKMISMRVETNDMYAPIFRVSLFSRDYLYTNFYALKGGKVIVCGKVTYDEEYGYQMTEPDNIYEEASFKPHIKPIYKKIQGLSENALVETIDTVLSKVHEPFEWELMQRTKVIDYKTALTRCHHPQSMSDVESGTRRLLLNDLLYLAIGIKKMDSLYNVKTDVVFKNTKCLEEFRKKLPFEMTHDQKKAVDRISEGCSMGERCNLLLQGDVGSGKTVVAMALMILAKANGYQSVLMTPREVLARQHYEDVKTILGDDSNVCFISSGMKAKERKDILKRIKTGQATVVIGTHSVMGKDVEYSNLGAIITDEEHLFGVAQKEAIVEKAQRGVHILSLSATPIPRTLANVLYGESKEIIQIKTMPNGRLPIKSAIVPGRESVYRFLLKEIKEHHQCYVVCPAIEDSEDNDIVNIEEVYKAYRSALSPFGVNVAVVHGKMDKKEAVHAIETLAKGETGVLIATTLIEVGVNIPNATVMVIEQAERFGLAILHQLRGRVGRGTLQSYCILRSDDKENERLKALCATTDGFVIAEEDLKQRGSGNLLGVEQSGMNKYVSLMLQHPKLYEKVKELASYCVGESLGEGLLSLYEKN